MASSRLTAFFLPFFFWALLALFSLSGEFLTSRFRLFFNALVFFFVVFLLPKGFLRSTNELHNKEGKEDASHKTHSLFSFVFVFFFLLCVESDFFQDLLKEEKNLIIVKHSFSFFLKHSRITRARAKHEKKRPCCCFASSVLSPPHKKDIPHQSKVPNDTLLATTKREDATTTDDDDDNRRRALAKGAAALLDDDDDDDDDDNGATKMNPLRANDDALKQIMRRVFEEIKPFVTRHEPDVPEEDLPELSRTRDLSKADFTVQWSRFCAKRKVNPAEYVKNLSETIQRQIEEDGNRDGFIKSVQGVGPYMNIFVKRQKVFKLAINAIIEQGTKYGCTNAGQGKKVIIEHTSSNPNAPLHIGNLRNVMIGAHLARVMQACGCEVTQAFYVNDLGAQIGLTALAYSRIYTKIKPTMKIDQWIGAMYAVMNTCQELQQVGVQPGDLEVRRSFCSQFS